MQRFIAISILVFTFLVSLYCTLGDGRLHVTFLDIGQGDSILIQTPHNYNLLIDGGPKRTVAYRLEEELPFWNPIIDCIILTHADADHLNGLIDVVRRYDVKLIMTSAQFSETPAFQAFAEEVGDQEIDFYFIDFRTDLEIEPGLTWNTFYPLDAIFDGEDNDNLNNKSLVGKLTYGQTSFLFTGDVEEEGEKDILHEGIDVRSNILKLAHHGSNTGNSLVFLQAVQPDYAVVSVGANNRYNHPHTEVLERCEELGTPVLRTDELGSIHFISDGKTVQYQP